MVRLSDVNERPDRLRLVVLVLVTVAFLAGMLLQQTLDQRSGPDCQEDEALYPHDYTGPGDNRFSDYRCVHIDGPADAY